MCRYGTLQGVRVAPVNQRADNGAKCAALLGQRILNLGRHFCIDLAHDQPVVFQFAQLARQAAGSDAFQELLQLVKALCSLAEAKQDHPFPLAPDQVKRGLHRAVVEVALLIVAPLALLVSLYGMGDALTAGAAMVFFWARLTYYVVYVLRLPYVRTVAFMVGSGCQAVLALRLFGVL